jgi:hypothetical protein
MLTQRQISAAAFASVNIIRKSKVGPHILALSTYVRQECSYGLGVHIWNVPIVKFSPTFLQVYLNPKRRTPFEA